MRDLIANVIHEIWAHWMLYLFSKCKSNGDGSVTIPSELVIRWKRQINTPYKSLTEKEQESDKNQADKIINALVEALSE